MDYPGFRKWKAISDFLELFPADPTFVAATAKPESPGLFGVFKYDLKGLIVAAYSKILVVTPQLRTQRSILLLDRLMAIFTTPPPQPLHITRQTLPSCFPLYHSVASTGF
jgi:hypothetical protein